MLLKTLSLAGFKSFADRTRLDFHGGVNVVVGPNGSGKSNLVDALAWVMGTQATTMLRTERMDDVIFAGTATRPGLGRAEVTLTFDNADRFLPIDLDDVAMTRRLYRDGTSEYELNGTPCRLLDLQDLLGDGGVGRRQHVLVSQGQIGDILNARPDEHRAVIEEAAGITKHRGRRDRSVRRLEATQVDIERLVDILDQSKRRLGPLRRQANAALRYHDVRDEARALRVWLGGETLRELRARAGAAGGERSELESQVAAAGEEVAGLVVALQQLTAAAGEAGQALQRDTAAAARLETVAERLQRVAMVSRERRSSLASRLVGADERRRDLEAEAAQLSVDVDRVRDEASAARASSERRELALQALEDEERSLAEQVALPTEGVVANLRGDLRALETAAERDRRELEAVERRLEVVTAKLDDEAAEVEQVRGRIRETDAAVGAADKEYQSAREARADAQRRWEDAADQHRADQIAVAAARARIEAVEATLRGIGDPESRSRAEATDGVLGAVAARLDVPEDLARAVDAALETWRDAFVVAGDAMTQVARSLKGDGLGGVSLVSDGRAGEDAADGARRIAGRSGLDVLIDRLGPAADRGLALRLLGDVLLVEGWATAWEIVERNPEVRAVTPEGDVIAAGRVRLAEADGAGPAALEAAMVALERADREQARSASNSTTARREFDGARDRERRLLEELESLEARLAGHAEAVGMIERSSEEGASEVARLEERTRALGETAAAREERITGLRTRVGEFEGEERTHQMAWEALTRRRDEVAARRDDARRLAHEATAGAAAAAEHLRMLQVRLDATRHELAGVESAPVDVASVAWLEVIESTAKAATDIVRRHVAELRIRQRDLRTEAGEAGVRLDAAQRRRSELEGAVTVARERMSTLAVELAELRVRDESVMEALRRDADADESEALAAARPEIDEGAEPRDLLATREAELRRMGPVNPLAAAEYEELAAEVAHLDAQLADLEASRKELLKVIDALDDEMATLFRGAYEEIARLFEENFALVFPGGRGTIRLTEPDKPLQTGVEIEAQPLGKKVSRLSLLSGGERSLAALAFLFAVFRARPSPFYVLDEVEAALDDANLRRFLRLVGTLRESAQLVIITHQQQTMEAADILYGVTMEPGESSQVVTKRLDVAVAR